MARVANDQINTPNRSGKKQLKSTSLTKKSPKTLSATKPVKRRNSFKVEEMSTEKPSPKKRRSGSKRNSFTISDISGSNGKQEAKSEDMKVKSQVSETLEELLEKKTKTQEQATNASGQSNKAKKAKCFICHQIGHRKNECPRKLNSKELCWRCGSSEHRLSECDKERTDSLAFIKCYLCGETGHSRKYCPKMTPKPEKKPKVQTTEENGDSKSQTQSDSPKKTNKFREKCLENRRENGLIMLSDKVEDKICKLKKALRKKGLAGEEIKEIIRKKRRYEENKYSRMEATKCFKCRGVGHKLADCPLVDKDSEEAIEICYRCGSLEHRLGQCKQKTGPLPYAKCFVCQEMGHLSKDCSKNERGVYPDGGSCKVCGSVNHLAKDCPQDSQDKELEEEITLQTADGIGSADAETGHEMSSAVKLESKSKVISF